MLKEKGITLIALVITIIVLLILAGVTLATITGYDGILPNAQNAVNQYKEGVGNDQEIINAINALFKEYMQPQAEGGDTPGGEEPEEPITPPAAGPTTANIGDYVDIGNADTLLPGVDKTQNWRILDVDSNRNLLLILADYLPITNGCIQSTFGSDERSNTYNVWSKTSQSDLINTKLLTTSNWSGLVPSTLGATATVTGGPTKGQIEASFLAKHSDKTSWDYTTAKADDLYVPHNSEDNPNGYSNCYGYWLASASGDYVVWCVYYGGNVDYYGYGNYYYGVRPVVSLTSDIQFTKATSGGVTTWTIVNE